MCDQWSLFRHQRHLEGLIYIYMKWTIYIYIIIHNNKLYSIDTKTVSYIIPVVSSKHIKDILRNPTNTHCHQYTVPQGGPPRFCPIPTAKEYTETYYVAAVPWNFVGQLQSALKSNTPAARGTRQVFTSRKTVFAW